MSQLFGFSDIDDSIKKEISFDPLGLRPIWRGLAVKIFNNKITTVAYNLKHYTAILFHFSIINDFFSRNSVYATKGYIPLIVFLENLMVHSYVKNGIGGIPGVTKYESLVKDGDRKFVYHSNTEEVELLARQIQLGISGRYKTPFYSMNMDYSNLETEVWQEGFNHIKNHFKNDVDNITSFLIEEINENGIRYDDLNVIDNIHYNIFAKLDIPKDIIEFFLEKLGMGKGAASILYTIIDNLQDKNEINLQSVFIEAQKEAKGRDYCHLFDNIIDVEPFLTKMSHVFHAVYETNNIVLKDYENLNTYITKPSLEKISGLEETAKKRFKSLLDASHEGIIDIERLIQYHKEIMDERCTGYWLDIVDGEIVRDKKIDKIFESRDYNVQYEIPWKNSYYIPSVVDLCKSARETK